VAAGSKGGFKHDQSPAHWRKEGNLAGFRCRPVSRTGCRRLAISPTPLQGGADPPLRFAGRPNSRKSNKGGPSRFAPLIPLRRDDRVTREPQSTGAAKPLQGDMAEVCSTQAGSTGLSGVGFAFVRFPFPCSKGGPITGSSRAVKKGVQTPANCLVVCQFPRVKSGNFTGALPRLRDSSLSGPGALQAAAS
jgi:hypothetical protein